MRYPSSRHRLIASSIALLTACAQKPAEPTSAQRDSAPDSTGIAVSGVVRKAEVGVSCWQLIANDSTHYELRADQAPAEILVDQKQVTVSIKRRPDLVSNCMVGQIIDVVKVE